MVRGVWQRHTRWQIVRGVWTAMPRLLQRALKQGLQAYGCHVIKQTGVWFVDIPRTSSSSIRFNLAQAYGIVYGKMNYLDPGHARLQVFADHLTARNMIDLLGFDIWSRLFTFAVVRNPWDRVVSLYEYRRLSRLISGDLDFDNYVRSLALWRDRKQTLFYKPHLWMGAADYVCDEHDNLIVSYVGKYEERSEVMAQLSRRLKLPAFGAVHTQSAPRKSRDYRAYYTAETRELIAKLYARDCALFGYSFD